MGSLSHGGSIYGTYMYIQFIYYIIFYQNTLLPFLDDVEAVELLCLDTLNRWKQWNNIICFIDLFYSPTYAASW